MSGKEEYDKDSSKGDKEGKKPPHGKTCVREVCTDDDYEKYLKKKECGKILDGYGVYHALKNATVTIETVTFIQIGQIQIPTYHIASGFFIKDHYIATAAHVVINFPLIGTPTRVNQIYVRVFNVNGSGENPVYKGTLVGADYVLDVASLRIDPTDPWNKELPKISCDDHPWIAAGNSRKYSPGRSSYVISSTLGQYYQGITEGVVRDNKSFSLFFGPSYESVVATNAVALGASGAPLIGNDGRWLSIITFPYVLEIVPSFSGGPSQFLAEHVLNCINSYKCGIPAQYLEEVTSMNGNYFKYIPSFIGIAWYNYFAKEFQEGTKYKKTQGVIVTGVDRTSTFFSVFNSIITTTSLLITHVDGYPIGDLSGQYGFSDITWFKNPGDTIKITYRLGEEKFGKAHDVCNKLIAYPSYLDRPSTSTIASYTVPDSTDNKLRDLPTTLPTSTELVSDSGSKVQTVSVTPEKISDDTVPSGRKINGKDLPPRWS